MCEKMVYNIQKARVYRYVNNKNNIYLISPGTFIFLLKTTSLIIPSFLPLTKHPILSILPNLISSSGYVSPFI